MNAQSAPREQDAAERRELGKRFREARNYLGLEQEEVASYLGNPSHGSGRYRKRTPTCRSHRAVNSTGETLQATRQLFHR